MSFVYGNKYIKDPEQYKKALEEEKRIQEEMLREDLETIRNFVEERPDTPADELVEILLADGWLIELDDKREILQHIVETKKKIKSLSSSSLPAETSSDTTDNEKPKIFLNSTMTLEQQAIRAWKENPELRQKYNSVVEYFEDLKRSNSINNNLEAAPETTNSKNLKDTIEDETTNIKELAAKIAAGAKKKK